MFRKLVNIHHNLHREIFKMDNLLKIYFKSVARLLFIEEKISLFCPIPYIQTNALLLPAWLIQLMHKSGEFENECYDIQYRIQRLRLSFPVKITILVFFHHIKIFPIPFLILEINYMFLITSTNRQGKLLKMRSDATEIEILSEKILFKVHAHEKINLSRRFSKFLIGILIKHMLMYDIIMHNKIDVFGEKNVRTKIKNFMCH